MTNFDNYSDKNILNLINDCSQELLRRNENTKIEPVLSNREKVYALASSKIGLKELPGKPSNPEVEKMYKAVVGVSYTDDVAWCAAFVGWCLEECGIKSTGSLLARSYLEFGKEIDIYEAQKGDIVIFWRDSPNSWKGHVGFYEGYDEIMIKVLGGNQSNQVKVSGYYRNRLLSVRRIEG